MPVDWLTDCFIHLADLFGCGVWVVKGVAAIFLVSLLCGLVGSQVIGNRMAFFSDTMAHCAFAGVAIGYLSLVFAGVARDRGTVSWAVPLVMILFGSGIGAAIVTVRDRTGLSNDTVIGVFFAFAIGFGAMLFDVLRRKSNFQPDNFLFGSPLFVAESDIIYLFGLLLFLVVVLSWRYNQLVFASFNASLARTRRINMALNNYLFIVILSLVVNLSIPAVGVLLINGLLVVPGAAAANVARNLRQMFWYTVLISVSSGMIGFWLSTALSIPIGEGEPGKFGPSGTIVVTAVGLFTLSVAVAHVRRNRRGSDPPALSTANDMI